MRRIVIEKKTNDQDQSNCEYHAHVYYCSETIDQAKKLIGKISKNFSFEIGRIHEKPLGPHPLWSCQIKFHGNDFGIFVQWLIVNRNGLDIFIHLCTEDNISDHSDYVCWLGKSQSLKLDIFK